MTKPPTRQLLVLGSLALVMQASGCILGSSIATFEPARSPRGITLTVNAHRGVSFKGELLSMSDSGMLMLVDDRVAFVFTDAIDRIRPGSGAHEFRVTGRNLLSIPSAAKLMPLSRYPFGIAPPIMNQLLTACSQQLPELVRAPLPRP